MSDLMHGPDWTQRHVRDDERAYRTLVEKKVLVPVEPPDDIPADAKLMWVWSTSDLGDFDWREVRLDDE